MSFVLHPGVRDAAERHARVEYPHESCGLVVGDVYLPCENEAADPLQDFAIATAVYLDADATGDLHAVIHSHPDGPHELSGADLRSQAATGLPWVVIPLDAERVFQPVTYEAPR